MTKADYTAMLADVQSSVSGTIDPVSRDYLQLNQNYFQLSLESISPNRIYMQLRIVIALHGKKVEISL